ncbi:hypothetical protein ACDP63_16710 [Paracoccus sp. P2]|uniref:hypothetical protein n=1 Tax=Paracoccus sp. P2 TaxID=3248840 RepID=UPI00391EE2C6
MNIVHLNEGAKLAFELEGCVLTLGGTLTINLAEEQQDTERVISVFADAAGQPELEGDAYAALIIIPPRRYVDEEVTETVEGEEVTQIVPVPQPCQADAVTLQLWALPENPETPEQE